MNTLRQAAQQALEALVRASSYCDTYDAIGVLRQALEAERQDEPSERPFSGLPLVIAGAIFDFAGFLTTRPNTIEVGSTANAAPMADLVKEWAELRGLSLDDAAVLSWQELLHTHPQPAQQRLTDEQIDALPWGPHEGNPMTFAEGLRDFARAIERAHGIGVKT
jgi:hypothetical protein